MPILNRAAEMQDEIAGWRRHLHAIPELNFDLHQTAAFVADRLAGLRLRRGGRGDGQDRRRRVIRGKTDSAGRWACAPTWTRCRSTSRRARPTPRNAGRCMPAAMTATPPCCWAPRKYLAETRNFDGTVVVIFQPAEEGGGGGLAMVRGRARGPLRHPGVLRHAQHARHAGRQFAIRPGAMMAAADHSRSP